MRHKSQERRNFFSGVTGKKRSSTARTVLVLLIALMVFLQGCASAPSPHVQDLWGLLPAEQSIYFSARIRENREFLKEIFEEAELSNFSLRYTIDHTDVIAASIALHQEASPDLYFTASGSYPRVLVGWQMFWDRGWQKVKEEIDGESWSWYVNDDQGLQMKALTGNLIAASNGNIQRLLRNYRRGGQVLLPEMVRRASDSADVFVYLPVPAEVLSGGIIQDRVAFSLSSLWASLDTLQVGEGAAKDAAKEYLLSGTFELENPRAARLYGAILKLALAGWLHRMGVGNLQTVREQLKLSATGEYLFFTGIRLPEKELKQLLVRMFRGEDAGAPQLALES